jgi:hypothetical protein
MVFEGMGLVGRGANNSTVNVWDKPRWKLIRQVKI